MVMGLAALFASVLIAGCGAHSSNQSTETFTVYEDAPKMSLLDLGAPGNSLGDVYHFSAPLHSERGGPVTGEVIGSKTLVKVATDANPKHGEASNALVFYLCRWQGPDYCVRSCRLFAVLSRIQCWPAGRPPILGGTGKYMGARGQVTSTRNADGSYTQVFTLLK